MKLAFVTVGTTKFEELVRAIDSEAVLEALRSKGFTHVRVQLGNGEYIPFGSQPRKCGLEVEWYRLKPSLAPDFEEATLVITHAGYGCLMESLALRKQVVAVVNETLMHNHQVDIAHELERQRHAAMCVPATLHRTLAETDFSSFRALPAATPAAYAQAIDALMGF